MGGAGGQRRQRREGGDAQCLAQDALRQNEDAESGVERRQRAQGHRSGQEQNDELVDLAKRQAQHTRSHQAQHLAHAGIAHGQQRAIARTQPAQTGQLHQQVAQRAGHRAPGQPPGGRQRRAAAQRRADQPAGNDADVVDRWGQRRQQEVLPGVERRH